MIFALDDGTRYYINIANINYCDCIYYERGGVNSEVAVHAAAYVNRASFTMPDKGYLVRLYFCAPLPHIDWVRRAPLAPNVTPGKETLGTEGVYYELSILCNEGEYKRFTAVMDEFFGEE